MFPFETLEYAHFFYSKNKLFIIAGYQEVVELVELLIVNGANVNAVDRTEETALFEAIQHCKLIH